MWARFYRTRDTKGSNAVLSSGKGNLGGFTGFRRHFPQSPFFVSEEVKTNSAGMMGDLNLSRVKTRETKMSMSCKKLGFYPKPIEANARPVTVRTLDCESAWNIDPLAGESASKIDPPPFWWNFGGGPDRRWE